MAAPSLSRFVAAACIASVTVYVLSMFFVARSPWAVLRQPLVLEGAQDQPQLRRLQAGDRAVLLLEGLRLWRWLLLAQPCRSLAAARLRRGLGLRHHGRAVCRHRDTVRPHTAVS